MKKVLMILGGILLLVIVVVGIGVAVLMKKSPAWDLESKAYVDQVAPIILADLNTDTLLQFASIELKKTASPEEFDQIFSWLKQVGKLIEYKGSVGEAKIVVTLEQGLLITGEYQCQVEFETGSAQLSIRTIKKGDNWQIMYFYVNSKALTGKPGDAPPQQSIQTITNEQKAERVTLENVDIAEITECNVVKAVINGNVEEVTLYGVDCPKPDHKYHFAAKATLSGLLSGRSIKMEVESLNKPSGSRSAILYADNIDVTVAMIQNGCAWVNNESCQAKICKEWLKEQRVAKSEERGYWKYPAMSKPVVPDVKL